MGDKPIGTRGRVKRITRVEIELADGEVPDQTVAFGSTVFVPQSVLIEYESDDGAPFKARRVKIAGPRRLASGGTSQSQYIEDSLWLDYPPVPDWVGPMADRHCPADPRPDDLPAVPTATDLDGS